MTQTSKSNQFCLSASKRDNLYLELPTILYNVQRFKIGDRSEKGSPCAVTIWGFCGFRNETGTE